MAVFRVERTRDYTVMCNHHLKDSNLSLKAKGLLSMIVAELFFNHSSTETFRDKLLKLALADSSRLSASDGQELEKTEILR